MHPLLSFCFSLSLSLCLRLQTVLNVGHSVWKLLSLSFSLPIHSFQCFLSLSLPFLHWGCDFSGLGAGCGIARLAGYRCTGYDLYCIWRVQNLHNHKAPLHLYPGRRAEGFHHFISTSTQVETEHSQSPRGQLLQECFQRREGSNLWHRSCLLTAIQNTTHGTLHVSSLPKSTTWVQISFSFFPLFVCLFFGVQVELCIFLLK